MEHIPLLTIPSISLILIAFALSMDAFAVAIATGVSLKTISLRQRFRLSWHFGLFQALMPVIGWYSGSNIHSIIEKYDHWVAAVLLSLVGLNMIRQFFTKKNIQKIMGDPTKGYTLIILSLSTSIDALAVGISMSMLNISIILPAILIGLIALVTTLVGLELGAKFSVKSAISKHAQLLGGLILIIIGLNILYDHGVFSVI